MEKNHNLPYVLSDLDGTITSSSLKIKEETIEDILKYQQASEGKFSFITGRLVGAIKFLANKLDVSLPIISCNGALISDWKTDEIFYIKYIDKNLIIEILNQLEVNKVEPVIYTNSSLIGLRNNYRMEQWKIQTNNLPSNLKFNVFIHDSIDQIIAEIKDERIRPIQLVLYAVNKEDQIKAKNILSKYQNQIEMTKSLDHVFNITAYGVDKFNGLKILAKILKINYQDIVVFGDNYNDISMLKGVKHSYAVANGVLEAKNNAYGIVPARNDNGVGKKLSQLIETGYYD